MSNTTTTTQTGTPILSTDSHPLPPGFVVQISKMYSLVGANYLKAFYLAVIAPIVLQLLTTLQSGNFHPDWKILGGSFVATAAAYLGKTYFSTSAVVKAACILLICMAGLTAKSQSVSLTGSLTNALPDSVKTWKGLRITGPAAVYAYSKSTGSTAMTGVGIAQTWQHLTTGGTWWVDYAAGIMFYAGGSAAPTSQTMIAAVGPYVSILNGFVTLGGALNLSNGKPLFVVGIVLPLISN